LFCNLEYILGVAQKVLEERSVLISLVLSGSHLYGTESENSDYDIRGIFLAPPETFLGLTGVPTVKELREGSLDIVFTEAGKEIRLALHGNCNVYERLVGKKIFSTNEYQELKRLLPMYSQGWSLPLL